MPPSSVGHGERQQPALAERLVGLGDPGAVAVVAAACSRSAGPKPAAHATSSSARDVVVSSSCMVMDEHRADRADAATSPRSEPRRSTNGTSAPRSGATMRAMGDYNRYCPVSMGSDVIADRWTPLIVRELVLGNTRFNDIARGLPGISRSLLVRRLGHLERAGRHRAVAVADRARAASTCSRRPAATSSKVLMALGRWSVQWLYQRAAAARHRRHDPDVVDAPPGRAGAPADRARRRRVRPHGTRAHARSGSSSTAARSRCACSTPGFDSDVVVTCPTTGAVGHLQRRRLLGPGGRQGHDRSSPARRA